MKTRIKSSALSLLVLVSSISLVFAQEYDDMYFSSKDRVVSAILPSSEMQEMYIGVIHSFTEARFSIHSIRHLALIDLDLV